eukprot:4642630-Amphidinium_carterae.1
MESTRSSSRSAMLIMRSTRSQNCGRRKCNKEQENEIICVTLSGNSHAAFCGSGRMLGSNQQSG